MCSLHILGLYLAPPTPQIYMFLVSSSYQVDDEPIVDRLVVVLDIEP